MSNLGQKVEETGASIGAKGRTYSTELAVFPILFFIFVGMFTNNLSSAGIQTNPVLPTPTCQQVAICYPTNVNGCDSSKSNCNISGTSTFSFLNPNSPFTLLMQGDIIGFVGSFSTNQAQVGPTSNFVGCLAAVLVSGSAVQATAFRCKSLSFTAGNIQFSCYSGGAGYCNFTSSNGNNSEWYCATCAVSTNLAQQIPIQFYGAYFNSSIGINGGSGGSNCHVPNNSVYCLYNLQTANPKFFTASNNLSNTFAFFGFLLGILLLIMSLQLGGGASITLIGSVTFSIGDQGAKLAQAFGIALTVWSFVFSEFGTWLNNLALNFSTILLIILSGMSLMGLYWRIFSLD